MDQLVDILLEGFTEFLTVYTQRDRHKIHLLLQHGVDFVALARQIQYFISGDFRHDIPENRVRAGIFDEETRMFFNFQALEYWHPDLGWSTDGEHADLGPLNGPLPIQRLIQTLYFVHAMALNLEQ